MSRPFSLGPEIGAGGSPRGFAGPPAVAPNPADLAPDLGEFAGAHLVTRKDIDPVQLQEDLIRRLGQDVTITLRIPSDTEPGYLRVQDVRSGIDLDIDPAILDEVVEQNARPETSSERFLREFDAAPSTAGKLLALRNWVARDVAEQEHSEAGKRRAHAQIARLMETKVATETVINPVTGLPIRAQAL